MYNPARLTFFGFLLLWVLFLSLPTTLFSENEKLILITQEWAPYQTNTGGTMGGIALGVVKCALEKIGIPYSIEFLPWKRAQSVVKAGRAHGFFAASRSDKRDAYARLSVPIAPQKWLWYLKKTSLLDPRDQSFIKNARVTATAGSNMGHWLRSKGYNIKFQPKSTEQLVRMLQIDRIDAVLANEWVFTGALRALNLPRSEIRMIPNKDKPLGVYFSMVFLTRHPEFLRRFNALVPGCTET